MNIKLEPDNAMLDEVIVVGYGSMKKSDLTGSVSSVAAKSIEGFKTGSVVEALGGQIAGVQITQSDGTPGSGFDIKIRGVGTVNGDSSPLYIVDGFEVSSIDYLPNSDIESVEVLKDASATAIWGTQGANGVLVIKTKQGTVGKTRFSFSSKWTMKEDPSTIPMLNGKEYTSLMQESIWNSAKYIGLNNPGNKYLNMLSDAPAIGDNPDWRYYDEYNQNTNWLDYVRQKALVSDNSFSMNGGGEKATYRFSLGYMSDIGTTIGTSMNRLNTSMVINYQFSNKLKFGADFSYSQTNTDANWTNTIRSEALSKMPNKSPFTVNDLTGALTDEYFTYHDPNFEGSFNGKSNYNPVAMAHEAINRTVQREGKITFRADYEILPGFYYKGWASINMRAIKTRRFLPQVVTGVEQVNKYANQSSLIPINWLCRQRIS